MATFVSQHPYTCHDCPLAEPVYRPQNVVTPFRKLGVVSNLQVIKYIHIKWSLLVMLGWYVYREVCLIEKGQGFVLGHSMVTHISTI